ncbi:amidohydrolase family protein [candidate division KSB1 bacterium]|nr:amidohydrolase family protein [candidate division KSB1 bacterium]
MPCFRLAGFSFILFMMGIGAFPLLGQEPKVIVLHNVSILALGGEIERRGQDLLIQGEKITAIRPTGWNLPADAVIVDCTDKWALPGLIDTHVHVARRNLHWPDDEQEFIEILAGGVTTVFDLGGRLENLKELKKKSQAPDWIGPRLFHCGSPLFGERVATMDSAMQRFIVNSAAEAEIAVRQLKNEGVDAIKIQWNVPSEVTKAAIDEAHTSGLLAIGHLMATSYQDAAKASIDILAHTSGLVTDYLGDGEREELTGRWFPTYLMAWEKVQIDRNARSKLQFLASRAVFFAPALAKELEVLRNEVATRQAALGEQVAQKFNGMLKLAFDLQAPLLAGSDYATDTNTRVTLHDELESWVAAGLEPRFAIEAATLNASHAIRQSDKIGQLAAGMFADIVVLNENPTASITTLREPWLVIRNGKLHRVDELKKRLRPHRRDEREIRAVLEQQEAAWNDYDLDRFMRGYWKNDSTIFASGGEASRGWNEMLSRYKKGYDTAEKMGRLKFTVQQVDFMGEHWAKVLGDWKLMPKDAKPATNGQPMSGGLFTLIFHRVPEGWKIVHDHTSVASVPQPAAAAPETKKKR